MASLPQELFGPREVGATVSTVNNEADIAVLPNGQTVVVWTARLPGPQDVVYMQRFDAVGDPLGEAVALGDGSRAQVEVLADGGYAVAWKTAVDIVGLRFDAAGNDVTGSLEFTTLPEIPTIEPGSNARYIIVPGTGTIERFGTEVFGEIVPEANGLASIPGNAVFGGYALTALADGGFVLTGSYYRGPDAGFDMFAMLYSGTAGALVPVDVRLSDDVHPAASDQEAQQGLLATTALDDGGFVLAWRNEDISSGAVADELRLQRFDKDGVAQGAAQTVGTSPDGISEIAVTTLEDGGFVVVWTELIDDPTGTDFSNVVVRIYNADGTARTTEYVPHALPGSQGDPAVVALNGGAFIVSWSQFSATAGDWEIFARGFTPDGIEIPVSVATAQFPLVVTSALSYVDSALAVTSDNELRAVWTEQARSGLDNEGVFNNVELTGFSALLDAPVQPTEGPDTLIGTALADTLSGLGGDDLLDGGADADLLFGNRGDDTLLGQDGDDRLDGGQGFDSVVGGNGDDTLFGGSGFDTLRGGEGADRVVGGDGRDLAYLGGGNDIFIDNTQGGVNGRDTVFANAGNDTVGGGNGDDVFHGQAGADLLLGRLGHDRLFGGDQNDTLVGAQGDDTVAGGNGRDRAFMGDGNDIWFDNDQVQFGEDVVAAGRGDDTIQMWGGDDRATGGDGADAFHFIGTDFGRDVITDYAVGEDRIGIDGGLMTLTQEALDAVSDTSSGDLVLTFNADAVLVLEGLSSNAGLLSDLFEL